MSGKVNKKLRKIIFQDKPSNRTGRRYGVADGTVKCMGARREYLAAKKDYKNCRGI